MGTKVFAVAITAALATTLGATAFAAGPLIYEETAKFALPDPSYMLMAAKVDGDSIIATGGRRVFTETPYVHERSDYAAFLFRRQSNGTWTYVRTLATRSCDEGHIAEDTCPISVTIRNGLAAISAGQVHVFRRAANGDWISEPSAATSGPGDVEIGTGVILASHPVCEDIGVKAFRPDSSGVWTETFSITSNVGCDFWGLTGNSLDVSPANRWITSPLWPPVAYIYEPSGTSWTRAATLSSPLGSEEFGNGVAIDDTRAFVTGPLEAPVHVFNRTGGVWAHSTDIVTPESMRRRRTGVAVCDRVYVAFADPDRGGSIGIFSQNASGEYEEGARLVASSLDQGRALNGLSISPAGSLTRVVAGGPGGVHVFDVSALGRTPAPTQYDFEAGNASGWTPIAGSSFSVVTASGTRVYRQSSLAGDAGAFVAGINWKNQAIEADVKPTATDGADRWVGLVVRKTDANHYYYVTLRQSNVLQIRRMLNGTYVTLASTPLTFSLNRNYRLRLEAVGTRLRAYVDGRLAVEASDSALTQGYPGVQMYRASADFDNVILSPDPQLLLLEHRVPFVIDSLWTFALGSWRSDYVNNQIRLTQQSPAGDGRAVTRVAANDQIVQVGATATSFAAGTGDRWFGMVARYVDAQNFYYVTVRRDNTISLRKLTNGAINVLDSAPMTVAQGTKYTLRFEAIGSSLRVYVNGNVVVEATDASYPSGKYGLATYKTTATFDDFVAWQP